MKLDTYGNGRTPDVQTIRSQIMVILNRKVSGELPFVRATDLRKRICCRVTAPSFFALLKEMEDDQLLMISGGDNTWAQCAIWDHPKWIEWRIQHEEWKKEMKEIEQREAERRRQWEVDNAPRLARERFQREVSEFFVDNSEQFFAVVQHLFRAHTPTRKAWLHSRLLSQL